MPIAWHPKRWWSFCVSEDEEKKWNQFSLVNAFNAYNMEALRHFATELYA